MCLRPNSKIFWSFLPSLPIPCSAEFLGHTLLVDNWLWVWVCHLVKWYNAQCHSVIVTVGCIAWHDACIWCVLTDIVVDNCAICRNHIMDHCKIISVLLHLGNITLHESRLVYANLQCKKSTIALQCITIVTIKTEKITEKPMHCKSLRLI